MGSALATQNADHRATQPDRHGTVRPNVDHAVEQFEGDGPVRQEKALRCNRLWNMMTGISRRIRKDPKISQHQMEDSNIRSYSISHSNFAQCYFENNHMLDLGTTRVVEECEVGAV